MRIFRYLLTFSLSFAFVFAAGCSDPKPDYSEFYKPQPGDEPEEPVNPGLEDNQLKVMSFNVRYSSGDDGANSWDNRKKAVPAMFADQQPTVLGVQEARLDQKTYMDENCAGYKSVGVGRTDGQNAGEFMAIYYLADAVKLEGGEEILESVERILTAGIPIMGHLGLTPQSIHKFGTYTVRAREEAEAEKLVRDARLLEEAGCFAVVLEKIPAVLAERVSKELSIPTIGIGAGGGTDGQVLVIHDMLGINKGFSPRFLRRYADLHTVMIDAVGRYVADVKSQDFPNEQEQY